MKNNVVWRFEIYVADMARAQSFYLNVFQKGDRINLSDDTEEMLAFPWEDSAQWAAWALVKMEWYKPSWMGTLVYFSCEDCKIEESRITENGWKIIKPKENIGDFGYITIAQDTEWNTIWLHSTK